MNKVRWVLELLLAVIDAGLKHLRDGPGRAAELEKRKCVVAALEELDQAEAKRAGAKKGETETA